MTHQSTDPYLRQHEARYRPDEMRDREPLTSRRSAGSTIGIVAAVLLAMGVVAVIAFGQGATTDPVEAPAATDVAPAADDPAPVASDAAPVAPDATVDPAAPVAPAVPDGSAAPVAPDAGPADQ